MALLDKISDRGVPLGKLPSVIPYRGVLTGLNEAFLIDTPTRDRLIDQDPRSHDIIKPFVRGQDIARWYSNWVGFYMIFARRGVDIDRYPSVKRHLERFREQLEPKPHDWTATPSEPEWPGRKEGTYAWYEIQDSTDYWTEFEKPKIIFQELSWWQTFQIDETGLFLPNTAYLLTSSDPWLLAVLNAPIFWWWSWRKAVHGKDEALRLIREFIVTFPIPVPSNEIRVQAESITALLTRLTRHLCEATGDIDKWLREEIGIAKLGKTLAEADRLSIDELIKAIAQALPKNRKPSEPQIAHVRKKYSELLLPTRKARSEVITLEQRLSDLVSSAYGLTHDEMRLMWSTAPPRMPLDRAQELDRLHSSVETNPSA